MAKNKTEKNDRFQVIYEQAGLLRAYEILEDRETGVRYLFIKDGYGVGLTPLLDEKGNTDIRKAETVEN